MNRVLHAAVVSLGGLVAAIPACGAGFTFVQQPSVVFANNHFPTHLAAADFNGDGHVDVVVPGRDVDGFAYILLNDGGGAFLAPVQLVTGGQTDWVEVGDIDGDGLDDLVFAYRSRPSGLAIMRGAGGGRFQPVEYAVAGRELRSVALRDFDGDGDLDAAGLDYFAGQVLLWTNDGSGGFVLGSSERLNEEFFGFANPNSIVAGDLDLDGDQDLVATSIGAGRICVLLNRGDGSFVPEVGYKPPQTLSTFPAVSNSALGDMDGDGDLDIVTPWIMGYTGQLVGVMLNGTSEGAAGSFAPAVSFPSALIGISWWPALGDLDGDGDLDAAIGYGLPGPLGLMMNFAGPEGPVLVQLQTFDLGNFVRCILPVDMDNDGDLDLVVLEAPSNQVIVMRNDTPQAGGSQDGGVAGQDEEALAAIVGPPVPTGPPERTGPPSSGRPGSGSSGPGDRNGDGLVGPADLALDLANRARSENRSSRHPAEGAGTPTNGPKGGVR